MLLGVPNGSAEKVEYFSFFKGEMVVVNIKLSSHLDSLVLKGWVYAV